MPIGFYSAAFSALLVLFTAEDDGNYFTLDQIKLPGSFNQTTKARWLAALTGEGLVVTKGGLFALTLAGYDLVDRTTEAVWHAQRALD
jgi:hypothetical protein